MISATEPASGTGSYIPLNAPSAWVGHYAASTTASGGAPYSKGVSQSTHIVDNGSMESPFNRPELDAKLETIEARMDGRLARMEAVADSIKDNAREIKSDIREIRGDMKSLKSTVITTAIAAVITIVLGVAGFNAALTSNMLTAFQAGQQTAQHK